MSTCFLVSDVPGLCRAPAVASHSRHSESHGTDSIFDAPRRLCQCYALRRISDLYLPTVRLPPSRAFLSQHFGRQLSSPSICRAASRLIRDRSFQHRSPAPPSVRHYVVCLASSHSRFLHPRGSLSALCSSSQMVPHSPTVMKLNALPPSSRRLESRGTF